MKEEKTSYRGRLAPTPSGHLHLGHGQTFQIADQRCREAAGTMVLRIEDLDPQRSKPEYLDAALEDFSWMGLAWQEGPCFQSQRRALYIDAWQRLKAADAVYPCMRSRKDVREAASAPHPEDEDPEPIYPPAWRVASSAASAYAEPVGANWRFRVPDGTAIRFSDGRLGEQVFVAGEDFGDFVVWRRDDVPAYELAVVVDDIAMGITEVVRGEDLLCSTARQILVYQALQAKVPLFFHTPLVRDADGIRLAKRHDALAMKSLREAGLTFAEALERLDPGHSGL
ncbi:MAG: tRNA glutamyl-Q(34) synthetase GluQRS [Verrucomicrobiota bacterium]